MPEEQKIETKHQVDVDLSKEIRHAIDVSNLAYDLAGEYGLDSERRYQLAIAGMLHDIGKLKLTGYLYGDKDSLVIEELRNVRLHPALGYQVLQGQGYSDFVLESILCHHENYDGSGYPHNLQGKEIPVGGRILRVCDVYCALTADRPYRGAFDSQAAVELMIEEVKNFDMRIFLAFQRVIHSNCSRF